MLSPFVGCERHATLACAGAAIIQPLRSSFPIVKPIPALLILTGAIPFPAATLSLIAGGPLHPTVAIVTLVTYAAVALSFLCGIQWGIAVSIAESAPTSANRLFVLSAVPVLLAWGILWLNSPAQQIGAAFLILLAAWALDALLRLRNLLPGWFFRLRSLVTLIIGISLAGAWLKLAF